VKQRTTLWIVGPIVGVILAMVGAFRAFGGAPPVRVLTHYSWDTLAAEARTMSECAECHDTTKFHSCDTCHDDHGAVELAGVPFYAVIHFTWDVPEPGFVLVNDVLPYTEQPNTRVPLLDFLADQGVADFESVTLASNDGGFVTIEQEQLTDEAWLLPYEDGIRFAAVDLHISAWIKGITRVIVVGRETPLRIDGAATSMGRLLLGPTQGLTLEQTDVMLKSEEDGQTRRAKVASRAEGVAVTTLVANPDFTTLRVTLGSGEERTLSRDEVENAVLVLLRGEVTLVRPDRGRTEWVRGVTGVEAE
jgi:hypothetical protein